MPRTDLSIGPSDFVQFDWNGWREQDRTALYDAASKIAGVIKIATAGGNSSIHVYYDRETISQADLIAAVAKAADEILPGHNFSA